LTVVRRDGTYSLKQLRQIGSLARQWILRVAPDCSVLDLTIPYFQAGPRRVMPWEPVERGAAVAAVAPELLADVALGGAVSALARAMPVRGNLQNDPIEVVAAGVKQGLSMLAVELHRQGELLGRFASELERNTGTAVARQGSNRVSKATAPVVEAQGISSRAKPRRSRRRS